nr:TolC family protein [Pseudomonas sp. R5(2019)]
MTLCLLAALPLQAAEKSVLSLDQALQAAFANNPDLAVAQGGLGVAQGEREQAGLIPNPELAWEAEDTRRDSRTTTVTLSQTLELGGKRGARVEVASQGQALAQVQLERQRNTLRAEVIGAYQGALRAQQREHLAGQSQALAERGLRVAQGRINAGKASPIEASRAQVFLAEVQLERRRAADERASAYQRLAELTGAAYAAFERLEEATEPAPAVPETLALLERLNETADLRLAQLQIDQGDAALGLEQRRRIPDLTVSIGSQYSATDRERVNVLGLSMPLPLFDRNQGNVLAASRRADQARDLRNAAELRLRTELRQALDQWRTAEQALVSFDQVILPSAQRAVDAASRGFEAGKFNFLDVLDAQRTLISARDQYLQTATQLTEARVRVERVFGDLSAWVPAV